MPDPPEIPLDLGLDGKRGFEYDAEVPTYVIPKRPLIWIHGYAGERRNVID